MWIVYTPAGSEFALVEDCEAMDIKASAPRKAEAVRTGNKRWPEARVTPYLGNYVFAQATAEEWHWLKEIKYVRSIMGVSDRSAALITDFCDEVERQFSTRMAEIERAEITLRNREASRDQRREALKAMQAYQPADLLEVMTGPLAGQIVRFGAMVERAASKLPEIEVALDGMGWGTVRLDPLSVRKVG